MPSPWRIRMEWLDWHQLWRDPGKLALSQVSSWDIYCVFGVSYTLHFSWGGRWLSLLASRSCPGSVDGDFPQAQLHLLFVSRNAVLVLLLLALLPALFKVASAFFWRACRNPSCLGVGIDCSEGRAINCFLRTSAGKSLFHSPKRLARLGQESIDMSARAELGWPTRDKEATGHNNWSNTGHWDGE